MAAKQRETKMKTITFLTFCLVSLAVADDLKTIEGKEYKNVTVRRVEADGIVLVTRSGISKVYFTELSKEVQERFHYDSAKAAAAYAAQQGVGDAATTAAGNVRALEDRLRQLQAQEDNLLAAMGEGEQAQRDHLNDAIRGREKGPIADPRYHDPLESQLPLLDSKLAEIRDEKDRVKQQLDEARRTAAQSAQPQQLQRIICPVCHGEGLVVYDGGVGTAKSLKGRQSDFPIVGNPLERRGQTCPICGGAGYKNITIPRNTKICPDCHGMGLVYARSYNGTFTAGNCARCRGTGLVADIK
jgi:DnaJ-class molecular chaperone